VLRGYFWGRFAQFLLIVWGAATLNFFIPRLAPGDPIRERFVMLQRSGGINQASIDAMVQSYQKDFGLDQPLWLQYGRYLWNVAHLDFGYSLSQYPARVLDLIAGALPWTIGLLVITTVSAFVLGTALGALMAWPRAPRALGYLALPLLTLSSTGGSLPSRARTRPAASRRSRCRSCSTSSATSRCRRSRSCSPRSASGRWGCGA
jgi:peptide/nickel transport system permease protein